MKTNNSSNRTSDVATSFREVPFGRPIIGDEERKAVEEVLHGHLLTHGPRVKEFEAGFAAFTGAQHAVATASCTASLHLAYFYLGIGEGDEVIVPAQTHIATAHAVELCGGTSIFADAEPRTGNIDIDQLEDLITERTRAISVVHYLGLPVDMDRVMAIAQKHGLFVVEDCALAIGSYYKGTHAGLIGDLGCFSFYPVKHMTTAEGGMTITKHQEVARQTALHRAFGIDRNIVSERKIPGTYDAQQLGFNYRLNELGAALGIEQLKRVPGFLEQRRSNYYQLRAGLAEIDEVELLDASSEGFESSYYCMTMLLKEPLQEQRYEIMMALKARGVGTSIYYPRAVPHMTYYQEKYGFSHESFPVAGRISRNCIALPVGPHVDEEDVAYMIDSIKEVLWNIKKA